MFGRKRCAPLQTSEELDSNAWMQTSGSRRGYGLYRTVLDATCAASVVDRIPSKAAFYMNGEPVDEYCKYTDQTADFIVFLPLNLGFLLTSVFILVYN